MPNRKITRLKVQTKTFVGFVLTERYHILMKQNHQKQKKKSWKNVTTQTHILNFDKCKSMNPLIILNNFTFSFDKEETHSNSHHSHPFPYNIIGTT